MYRIAADLESNLKCILPAISSMALTSVSTVAPSKYNHEYSADDSKFIRYCKALSSLEAERLWRLKKLAVNY